MSDKTNPADILGDSFKAEGAKLLGTIFGGAKKAAVTFLRGPQGAQLRENIQIVDALSGGHLSRSANLAAQLLDEHRAKQAADKKTRP